MKEKVRSWLRALENAHMKDWEERADKVVERYRDESDMPSHTAKINLLWSNISIQNPAIYSKPPTPVVARRYRDKDPVGLTASEVLERALSYTLDDYDYDEFGRSTVMDYSLAGRCVGRVDYRPQFGDEVVERIPVTKDGRDIMGMPVDGEVKEEDGAFFVEESYTPVVYEQVVCSYVHYKDFRHGPGRTWDEVTWVAFRAFMREDSVRKRFGAKIANDISYNQTVGGDLNTEVDDEDKRAEVWEIWDKNSSKVYWICPAYPEKFLDEQDPPLKLNGFFPCPRPRMPIKTTGTLEPIPEFVLYQDQADQVDALTAKIDDLVAEIKLRGAYDAAAQAIPQLADSGNVLVPVESSELRDRGGIANAIAWWPLDMLMNALTMAYEARDRAKQELFEVSGFSDLVRGQSDPNETATAQGIKGQFVGKRLSEKRQDIANFHRDILRLKAEVLAEQFGEDTLSKMTGIDVTPEVTQLLRDDRMRSFRIDVETDSTVEFDQQKEKEQRMEFLTSVMPMLNEGAQIIMQNPAMKPVIMQSILFAVRAFNPAGRELEQVIEKAMEEMQPPPQQQGDPRAQMEAQKTKQELEQGAQEHQLTLVEKQQDIEGQQLDNALKQKELQAPIGF